MSSDAATEVTDHARARNKRLKWGILTSVVSRGLGFVAPIVMIPFAINTVGVERYGLWATALSLTAMAMFSDFGLGNGLMTKLSACYADGNVRRARGLIEAGVGMTSGLALVLALLGTALVYLLGAGPLLDSKGSLPVSESNGILAIVLLAFAVNIPLSLINRIQFAYQYVWYSNLWTALSSLVVLAFFVGADLVGAPALVAITAAAFAPPLVNLVNWASFATWMRPDLRIRRMVGSWRVSRELLTLGSGFLVISILTSLSMNADVPLVARVLGLDQAAVFSVAWRVASGVGILVTLVNLPLWPANGEALARGDVAWVRKTTGQMMLLSGGSVALAGTLLVVFSEPLMSLWLGDADVKPSGQLILSMMTWMLVLSVASPMFMVQNAAGYLRPQIVGFLIYLLTVIPLKSLALQHWGAWAAPAVGSVLYLTIVCPAAVVGMVISLRRAQAHHGLARIEGTATPSSGLSAQ